MRTICACLPLLLPVTGDTPTEAPPAPERAQPGHAAPDHAEPDHAELAAQTAHVERVGGDFLAVTQRIDGMWRSKKLFVDSPLPVGYPPPTPAGAIEIKRYPSVRRAEVRGERGAGAASRRGFYPLFNHIQSNGIAMTAPVEMDLPGWTAAGEGDPESWTMSFLYRVPELRETGREGQVEVRDTRPVTVVSMGTKGPYGLAPMRGALAELERWLKGQARWERAGAPRWLAYNGPYVPAANRWGEVQIPIRRRAAGGDDANADESAKPGTSPRSGASADAARERTR